MRNYTTRSIVEKLHWGSSDDKLHYAEKFSKDANICYLNSFPALESLKTSSRSVATAVA